MTPRPPRRFPILLVALIAVFSVWPHEARADGGCKPDGRQCATNISCCSRTCFKPAPPPGRSRAMFGQCCTPTTCTAQGKNCGTIPDGDCGDTLNCGTCTAPQTCGGGGVPNQCGCTPTTCGAADCGMIANGCGGTLNCGPCPTTTTSTTTTTTIPQCSGASVIFDCTCGNPGFGCGFDCAFEPTSCPSARNSCIGTCNALGGPGDCATAPCFDCTTGLQCQ